MSIKKIEFTALSKSDLEMILVWRNAPEVRSKMYTSHEITLTEHQAWFSSLQEDKTKVYFLAHLNNEPVGVVGFSEIHQIKGIATWAFYASPNAPRGTGSLMEYHALEYAFNELKLHKLRCEVLGFNSAVIKLHKKFGFQEEGVHREAFHDGNTYHDIVHLGIFEQEWVDAREELKLKLKIV
ncbi:UDP-4-amino-4,6-dideoxy-N-acetyl-beta-L-altrosamine N-acetyltransferase [Vibrio metschnikovii]|uniref:UDP-4-amino-4, 6-dideoxy-N-acetyl-beta-L-altrosamine N-acetyltransferase n=1 Tax=Vibrio metschnikovii TaxID=28172 RepID=UPI002879B0C8|nr:UDP-4-amino-4,6-dideoxy-N-acetyl-beta-L-altrosamine N-acetyltransferase [Vibrio metschnikovii]EKO3593546.1 UDP-4-amino-4,6-dideoxy-N-acetyl-beta-L-altrosamine N-acetyltransferase [Vibrio metschnikovii]EKO3743067.1 UDP-4-amino-4,6-dideoxy-N-acetyl-beta-L-altrosamine N-acetyltransferase [Vibrio metschnikovii]EKO3897642.1 UDP-4-amino-4,6-dideoxy-N-acetyl-beta-L-altrosamine N-acetyltransferase [Vibrio metschnikovii]EKO3913564.1 UDP-4-amino-4,6-dideoxy-N-acetyl-beta-L-altrosamine N-acetyltransfer